MYCPFIAVSSNSGYLILTLPFVTRNTSYSVEILSCDIRNLGIVNVGNVFVEGKLESSILLGVTSLPGTVAGYSCQAAVTFKLTFA